MSDNKKNLDNIRIVLVEPKVPGNVGAASRAMKNMGLSRLVLVNPWFLDHPQARYMAHNSEDILDAADIVSSIGEAVSTSVLVVGTTQRQRHGVPFMNPRQAAVEILESSRSGPVSILFGREDCGLLNDELAWCQIVAIIPSSSSQPSLNLAQAVMVFAYEVFMTVYPRGGSPRDYAPAGSIMALYDHLRNSLTALGLKQWNDGDNYMKSLRRVFSRTRLENRDVATIHKLCGEIDRFTLRVRDEMKRDHER